MNNEERFDAIEVSLEELLRFVQQLHMSHTALLESQGHLLNALKEKGIFPDDGERFK